MRHAIFALVFAAGCYGESVHAPEDPYEKAGPEGTEVHIDSAIIDSLRISELDTEKTRPIAKTIEWPGVSTEVGTTFRSDALVVDQIFRDDSDNNYGVRIRLKNVSREVLKLEYVIRFYSRQGGRIASWGAGIGQSERWQGFVVDPLRHTVIADSAKVMGAEGFRLYIRGAGANEDGMADDPSKKEERAAQRAAAGTKP